MMIAPWATLTVVTLSFAAGYWTGYRGEANRFEDFRVKVAAEAKVAQAKQEEMVKRHEQTNQIIEQNYQSQLDSLESYYRRLYDNGTRGGGVPTVPKAPRCVNGSPAPEPVPVVTAECAKAALRLKELQDWVAQISK